MFTLISALLAVGGLAVLRDATDSDHPAPGLGLAVGTVAASCGILLVIVSVLP